MVGSSRSKCQQVQYLVSAPLPLQTATFLLSPYIGDKEREVGSFYKGTNLFHEGSTLMT